MPLSLNQVSLFSKATVVAANMTLTLMQYAIRINYLKVTEHVWAGDNVLSVRLRTEDFVTQFADLLYSGVQALLCALRMRLDFALCRDESEIGNIRDLLNITYITPVSASEEDITEYLTLNSLREHYLPVLTQLLLAEGI